MTWLHGPKSVASDAVGHENKEMEVIQMLISLSFDVPLRQLPSSIADFVPLKRVWRYALPN